MSAIFLPDPSLRAANFETLPRLASLRQELLGRRAEVCIERARHLTNYFQDLAEPSEPRVLQVGRALRHFLSQKTPLFPDRNLLAGSTSSKPFGAPVYPELTGLTIWPELDVISERKRNPQLLSKEDATELNLRIFPYWMDRSILEATRRRIGDTEAMRLLSRIVFFIAGKAGTISHTVPCYQVALEHGLDWIIQQARERGASAADRDQAAFYLAVQEAMKGIKDYAANLSRAASTLAAGETDSAHRAELETMAEVCERVPAQPPRSFREAINALWLLQVGVHAESINMAISPGRLDQILYPWYRADVDAGRLTPEEAVELGGCLWLKLNDNTNLVPETAEELFGGSGTVPAVTLGGIAPDGSDAVNDLTYVFLRVTELMSTRDPSVNARIHDQVNDRAYIRRVAEVVATTKAIPALYSDRAAIDTLLGQGVALEHARDYAIIGCVELSASGRSYDASSSIMLNLVSVLELALYGGKRPVTGDDQIGPASGDPATFADFEAFWGAFTTQLAWLIDQAVGLNEELGRTHQQVMPTPLLSALFDGPMEQGRDLIFGGARYNSSGATHIGFADTVDSLCAIQELIYTQRAFTFRELLDALGRDFEGDPRLHAMLLSRTPRFGKDATATEMAKRLQAFLFETYQARINYRGGAYRPAFWTMTNHAGQGRMAGALPSGRRANRVFSSGITPCSQAAPELTDCLRAVGSLNPRHIPGGVAFNLKYPEVKGPEDLDRFVGATLAYFEQGGLHIQFNVLSYETLLEAKAHPEVHPDLLVRVSGYSAYFRDLNEAMKEEIITRTAYTLREGQAVTFPDAQRSMLPFV